MGLKYFTALFDFISLYYKIIFILFIQIFSCNEHLFRLDRLDFPQAILENSDVVSKNAKQNYFPLSLTRWLCNGYISDCQINKMCVWFQTKYS